MKRIIDKLLNTSSNQPFEQQIFNSICLIISSIALLTTVQNVLVSMPIFVVWITVSLFIFTVFLFLLSRFFNRLLLAKALLLVVSYLSVIFFWIYNFGADGTAIFLLFALIVWGAAIYKRAYFGFFIINVLFTIAIYIISYLYPEFVKTKYSGEFDATIDHILSYILASISVFFVINLIKRAYYNEKQIVVLQKTQLEQLNADLITKNKELEELNNNKDMFFSIIAHDLKNPYSAILIMLDLILKKFDQYDKKRLKPLIESIDESVKRTYQLLENLLVWSRLQSDKIKVKKRMFLLNEIIWSNLDLHTALARLKDLDLKFIEKQKYLVYADYEMINTIVRNFLSNAIKFNPHSGSVEISIALTEDAKHYQVKVIDRGIGISQNDMQKLFHPEKLFSTEGTDGERGTGLGLILCKEFATKNDGIIGVESETGKGSTFFFTVPVYTEDSIQAEFN